MKSLREFFDRDTRKDVAYIGAIAALAFMAGALLGAPLLVAMSGVGGGL